MVADKWPVLEGNYLVGDPNATIAICTLADTDLPEELKAAGVLAKVAIMGPLATENLGIEHLLRNIVSNPRINYLLLCGRDSRGHQAGQALLSLKANGVNADKRIIGALGPRPLIKNITDIEINTFCERVSVIDEINSLDLARLMEVVDTCLNQPQGLAAILTKTEIPKVKAIEAKPRIKGEWVPDAEGYFVILLNRDEGQIVCEHYTTDGILNEVVKGSKAEDIVNTLIRRSLLSRLDHAAYMGRELAKAEIALRSGLQYVQDEILKR